MKREKIMNEIRKSLPYKRFEHTLGVTYTAACLAMRYGADVEKARIAGLLHDSAKYMSSKEKIQTCLRNGIPISEYEEKNPELLHAKLGAYLAEKQYGIDDPEILSAITWHTTGKPGMTLLEKILYIADYMEPNRDQAPNLTKVRELAFVDLDECLFMILRDSMVYLSVRNIIIDPMTQNTYEYYKALRESQGSYDNKIDLEESK
ncbi:MAG: bis(5'-nucleosyl)-tetraphosphatase (symmetrical) YqeK [Eubacterium sp.]|nr:bis(5'-nucleosyl)-tetraphosphatase (symmetrical) YqeK [Eubacterium sp.]